MGVPDLRRLYGLHSIIRTASFGSACFSPVGYLGYECAETAKDHWRKRDRDSNTGSNLVAAGRWLLPTPASVAIKDVHATPCFEIWLEKRRRSSASSKYSVWCFSPCSNPSREIRRPSLLLISLKGLPLWRSRAARHAARREAGKLYRIGYLGNTYTIIGSRGTRSSQEWLSSSPESVE
jgi:hypothetical protein